jgi:transposase
MRKLGRKNWNVIAGSHWEKVRLLRDDTERTFPDETARYEWMERKRRDLDEKERSEHLAADEKAQRENVEREKHKAAEKKAHLEQAERELLEQEKQAADQAEQKRLQHEKWLHKIEHAGVRRRAELLDQQLDGLQTLRRTLRPELLAESRKHKAAKLLRQIPCIGPIGAVRLIALMQTPPRFRSKRQLWTYSGLGIETRDSAQYRYVHGQLQRTKKPQQIRGLNQNHNHEMKAIFKAAASRRSRP